MLSTLVVHLRRELQGRAETLDTISRNCQIAFQSSFPILHSYKPCKESSLSTSVGPSLWSIPVGVSKAIEL